MRGMEDRPGCILQRVTSDWPGVVKLACLRLRMVGALYRHTWIVELSEGSLNGNVGDSS